MVNIPGTCLSSILGFQTKQGSFGFQVCKYPIIYRVSYIPSGFLAAFLNHWQQYLTTTLRRGTFLRFDHRNRLLPPNSSPGKGSWRDQPTTQPVRKPVSGNDEKTNTTGCSKMLKSYYGIMGIPCLFHKDRWLFRVMIFQFLMECVEELLKYDRFEGEERTFLPFRLLKFTIQVLGLMGSGAGWLRHKFRFLGI